MKPEIKKGAFGAYQIKFDCPGCSVRLTSPLADAGKSDKCPDCQAEFKVPGETALFQYNEKQAARRVAKEEEAEIAKLQREQLNQIKKEKYAEKIERKSAESQELVRKKIENREFGEVATSSTNSNFKLECVNQHKFEANIKDSDKVIACPECGEYVLVPKPSAVSVIFGLLFLIGAPIAMCSGCLYLINSGHSSSSNNSASSSIHSQSSSRGGSTASDARTIGYSTVYARHPGASASVKTVDDLGNGKFHLAGRFTKKGSSNEQGFYIEMQFDPGETDTARIISFDTID